MRNTLAQWLEYYQTLHHTAIDLSLDRIRLVAQNMGLLPVSVPTFMVAGTNGKGTTLACLDALLREQGYCTGRLTSPHLIHYNERITLSDVPVADDLLIAAFSAIEQQRGDTTLSFFEINVLAALWVFRQAQVDVVLLEVGMGGRLDACNIVDADIAIITTVDLDHQAWLGDTRGKIGKEKAGIMRSGQPVILADPVMPDTVLTHAQQLGSPCYHYGADYHVSLLEDQWSLASGDHAWQALPVPHIPLNNAAAAMVALQCHRDFRVPTQAECQTVLSALQVTGRCQHMALACDVVLDVAHNPQSASYLAEHLQKHPVSGKTYALFSVLADKDITEIITPLFPIANQWHYAPLIGIERAATMAQMAACLPDNAVQHAMLSAGYEAIVQQVQPQDRIVIFGSFFTVAAMLEEIQP